MNQEKIKNIIEAALMVSDKPLSIARILELFEKDAEAMDRETIRSALDQLQEDYRDRGIELREVASGYRIQVRSDYAGWVNRLFDEKPPRYSRALLETLAIIAYRQPLTRAEIEDIRGVGVSTTIIKTLQEREWIKVVGHKDVPGRPELLATTKEFLDYFNLKKLSDLPSLAEIKELNKLNPDLFDSLENMEAADNRERESHEIENDDEAGISEPLPDDFSSDDDNKVIPITH
jgi:segregation and condensation protein B